MEHIIFSWTGLLSFILQGVVISYIFMKIWKTELDA